MMLFNTILSAAIARALRGPAYQGWEATIQRMNGGLS